ncbi:hypothetical protein BU25DRAFT_484242 [Macroventuria anomochaeta]|uniref:Uncharacterized protein n=1 Tax=Macroventuria anomochaeta TaxID=301207 RepID=A0ACB6S8C1_9PLEO|nr:uncharacterized protein BU25DRAFT_484242 [Macroventuria anomochaeta]KAF2630288.1 hypothetical protein BU25DRAFT_484242 [Macroventuria anomochaeta]
MSKGNRVSYGPTDTATKSVRALFRRAPWPELKFPTTGFEAISDEYFLEEESLDHFQCGMFYSANIGETFDSRYQVVGKLGYGATSTIYKRLSKRNTSHPGYHLVRAALDTFNIPQMGDHQFLVQNLYGTASAMCSKVVEGEMRYPAPRKLWRYVSVCLPYVRGARSLGSVMLGAFGAVVWGDERQTHDAQPDIYRCPEVMLRTERTTHLAEVVAMLGPPPLDLFNRELRSKEFFDDTESCEVTLAGQEQREFLEFVCCMLQWRPEDRMIAKQLLDHPWLKPPNSMEPLTHGVLK